MPLVARVLGLGLDPAFHYTPARCNRLPDSSPRQERAFDAHNRSSRQKNGPFHEWTQRTALRSKSIVPQNGVQHVGSATERAQASARSFSMCVATASCVLRPDDTDARNVILGCFGRSDRSRQRSALQSNSSCRAVLSSRRYPRDGKPRNCKARVRSARLQRAPYTAISLPGTIISFPPPGR